MSTVSYDPAPLLELLEGRSTCVTAMAREAGVNRRVLTRWRAGGRIRRDVADRCAVALGLHPLLVWPDYDA